MYFFKSIYATFLLAYWSLLWCICGAFMCFLYSNIMKMLFFFNHRCRWYTDSESALFFQSGSAAPPKRQPLPKSAWRSHQDMPPLGILTGDGEWRGPGGVAQQPAERAAHPERTPVGRRLCGKHSQRVERQRTGASGRNGQRYLC